MSEFWSVIFSEEFLSTVVRVLVPLLFASMSAYIAALAGIPNIAVEGIMLMSALFAVLGSYWTQSSWLGLLISIGAGLVMALILILCTINMGTNPILVGIALNTFAASFTVFLLYMFTQNKGTSASLASIVLPIVNIPIIDRIPVLRAVLSGQYTVTYLCIVCMILLALLVYRTPLGMRMKAAGLDERAAKTAGIDVNHVRIIAVLISGLLAALGGAYMTTGYLSIFTKNMIAGRGWIGIAAQAMGGTNMLGVAVTTFVFSLFQAITNVFSLYDLPSELINIIPYVGVLLGIILFSVSTYRSGKKG
ncbi:MAG: ABC transporter permease [Clostridiales bacterium]|nr:ABC transporter permease [Clostridiales bacterium]